MRAAWLLVLLAGCGLADYEKKMQDSDERAARFDEQAKVLGLPLDIPRFGPKEKNAGQMLYPMTLRPPKGIPNAPAKEALPAGNRWAYAPQPANAAAPFSLFELAFGKEGEKDTHEKLLRFFDGKSSKTGLFEAKPPGREKISFLRTLVEGADWEASVNTRQGKPVSIIYYWPKSQRATVMKTIDLSLETFAEGPETEKVRTDFLMGGPLGNVPR